MTRDEYMELITPFLAQLDLTPNDITWLRLDCEGIEAAVFVRDEDGNRIFGGPESGSRRRLFTLRVTNPPDAES